MNNESGEWNEDSDSLKMLLSSISDIVFSIDNEKRLVKLFQPYSGSEFGMIPDDFIGSKYEDVLPPNLSARLTPAIEEVNETGKPVEFNYCLEGEPYKSWFLSKVSAMKNALGKNTGYTVVSRNITDLKKEEEKRVQLEEKLRISEQSAVLGRVAAGVSHEINNPAAAITSDLNTLEDIAEQIEDDEKRKRMLKIINRDQRAVSRITNIVLAVKGAYRPRKWHKIDIIDEIELQLTLLHKEIKNRIRINRKFAAASTIDVCGSEIGQVILNLVKNAIDAIDGKGEITIETKDTDSEISIIVADSGSGIPAAVAEHIFEPFYTTKEVGKGTGLGLSISRQIIDRHNGKLLLENTDSGAIFTIILPKKRVENEKVQNISR